MVNPHGVRLKFVKSVHSAEVHFTSQIFPVCARIEFFSLQSIRDAVVAELCSSFTLLCEFGDAVIRADPQVVLVIGKNAINKIVCEPLAFRIDPKYFR